MAEKRHLSPLEQLCTLIDAPELAGVLHSSDYIQGLIFAIASAPEIPMPEQWFVWVFKKRGQLGSTDQADKLSDVLMALLQQQLKNMSDEQIALPPEYVFETSATRKVPLSQWFMGVVAGHGLLEEVWLQAWQKMGKHSDSEIVQLQKDLTHCLRLFTTFADLPLALEQAQKLGGLAKRDKLLQTLPQIFASLPASLNTYVNLSGRLVDFLPNQFETFQQNKP